MREFVSYEIDRAKLALEKMDWADRVDRAEKQALELWLNRLEIIVDAFPAGRALASLAFLADLQVVLEVTFLAKKEAAEAAS